MHHPALGKLSKLHDTLLSQITSALCHGTTVTTTMFSHFLWICPLNNFYTCPHVCTLNNIITGMLAYVYEFPFLAPTLNFARTSHSVYAMLIFIEHIIALIHL